MYAIDNILCATDFSRSSREAIRFAQFLALKLESRITLLYADEFDQSPQGHFVKDELQRAHARVQAERFAEEKFATTIDELKLSPAKTQTLVRFGAAYKEIVSEAESGKYSLVVISVRGIGCSSEHLIGRTAERVVRLCRTPVLTVRPGETASGSIRSILCATDFSEYGNFALPYAISLAKQFQAKLIMLHAADLTFPEPDLLHGRFPDLTTYHEQADKVIVEHVVGRDIEPANLIVRIAEEEQVGLVVMGTHGARGLRRVQIGNTTEDVIRRVSMPVLSITHPIHKMVFPGRFRDPSECKDVMNADSAGRESARTIGEHTLKGEI